MARSAVSRRDGAADGGKGGRTFPPVQAQSLDPALASLFASSLGPAQSPSKAQRRGEASNKGSTAASFGIGDSQLRSQLRRADSDDAAGFAVSEESAAASSTSASLSRSEIHPPDTPSRQEPTRRSSRKRKRAGMEADVEDVYMQKIAHEEAKDEEERQKKQKGHSAAASGYLDRSNIPDQSDGESFTVPQHESLAEVKDIEAVELEKASRTVFLGNVSNEAISSRTAEKQLRQHLVSFIPDLADRTPSHKVESIRFRSTAFAGALPKRAAFAKKEIMDSTTKSTNAYVIYSTKTAAREAVKRLNGSVVLGRHLRVDSVAHPTKIDHRRCVFVGNLGFVDDNSKSSSEDGTTKKSKPPSDVEEGLWVHFGKAGKVESVRVPRDAKSRIGKGFAYVQFEDENAVEAALQYNDQKFPPLLPRKLRVVRAKAQKKNTRKPLPPVKSPAGNPQTGGAYIAKVTEAERSSQGRARAILGKAVRSAESFVFEGHRASSRQGNSGLKLGGKSKKGPNGRRSRSKAWKASSSRK